MQPHLGACYKSRHLSPGSLLNLTVFSTYYQVAYLEANGSDGLWVGSAVSITLTFVAVTTENFQYADHMETLDKVEASC